MNTRARFEEIWPVPEGIYWAKVFGAYVCDNGSYLRLECMELNLRLDTFTRCQETTDVYVSLIQEMANTLEDCYGEWVDGDNLLDRAKQIMGDKK